MVNMRDALANCAAVLQMIENTPDLIAPEYRDEMMACVVPSLSEATAAIAEFDELTDDSESVTSPADPSNN